MSRIRFGARRAALAVLVYFRLTAAVFADEPAKLEVAQAKAPNEVAAPIRDVLDDKVLSLSSDGKPFFEFWFRKDLPLAKQPAGGTMELDTIVEGTVLGVLKVDTPRSDFRNEELPPGVYVVRYGIQPEDGNHLGVAPTRTFALLISASRDKALEPVNHKDLMKSAATINAVKHPSNLNLQPLDDASGDFPRLAERNDGQHKVLLLRLPATVSDSKEKTTLGIALVYEGTGQV